jgi:LmbE family N-acetylglucosaminyl deacetylase
MKAGEMDFTPILKTLTSLFPSHPLIEKTSLPFTIMILSPHPDDESIIGSLPLRLMHENNAHIINVAVTMGSNKQRQKPRLKELQNACELLEMDLDVLSKDWTKKARELKALIQKYQPHLILAPHLKDHHPAHIKTSKLLQKVLKTSKLNTLVAWTEFWGTMEKPNCLVEVPVEILELQMKALVMHEGEIARNPYHLRLPAWMMDNVRRGGEIISNTGGAAPQMAFGVIYHLQIFKNAKLTDVKLPTPFLSSLADLGQIFNEILEAASGSKTKVKRG